MRMNFLEILAVERRDVGAVRDSVSSLWWRVRVGEDDFVAFPP